MPLVNLPIIEPIVSLHFEEAAFLWTQRELITRSAGSSLADLVAADERLENHINGLRVSGDRGWTVCEEGLDPKDPGTLFVCAIMAFESGVMERIEKVVILSNESKPAFSAVLSGIGWMDTKRFNALIGNLVSTRSRRYRRLGIAACGIRRINPRGYLDQAVDSKDLFLKARALRAAGELKRLDLLPQVQANLQNEDVACRFEAARTACLLGDRSALGTLATFALSHSEFTLPALQVALRLADEQTAKNWLKAISKKPEQVRVMLTGVGYTGDPAYIPMLIMQMSKPELARVAGEAFSMITGVDFGHLNLAGKQPDGFVSGPNDNPDDTNVAMDPDENLVWPKAERVKLWWDQNNTRFPAGNRFLAGDQVSQLHCANLLRGGSLRVRQYAALELALSDPNEAYFNTVAPAQWQLERL